MGRSQGVQTAVQEYDRFWEGIPRRAHGTAQTAAPAERAPRTWWWVLIVLAGQAALSLRLRNTAFQDEALYLTAGGDLWDRLRDGMALGDEPYSAYFSGSPYLYPLGIGPVDDRFGLVGARAVSLVFMLLATLCVWGMARRLAGPWAGVGAAAMFAVAQSTEVLGNFATFDAPAVFLLALTGWLVVRSATAPWLLLPAALTGAAMVMTKYAASLYLPTLCVLVVLVAWEVNWVRALTRGVLFAAATGGLGYAAMHYLKAFDGLKLTTTDRQKGTTTLETFVDLTVHWAGPVLALAVLGVIVYTSPLGRRMTEDPPRAWRRLLIGLLLTVTGVLAPISQLRLKSDASLHKHIGFGLVFAAVMAGVLLAALIKVKIVGPVLALALVGGAGYNGYTEATKVFDTWPNTKALGEILVKVTKPGGVYFSEQPEVPAYYTSDTTDLQQWVSPYAFSYGGADGPAAYVRALHDGHFSVIVLAVHPTPGLYDVRHDELASDRRYHLAGTVDASSSWGRGKYEVWVKNS